jgi:hypothetical protein
MSTETMAPVATEVLAPAAQNLLVTSPVNFYSINVTGQNAHASTLTDHLGNRLIFHAHAKANRRAGTSKKTSTSESVIAIPFTATGLTSPRKADVTLYAGWLGIANKAKTDWLISGSYGRWRVAIDGGLKLQASTNYDHPLAKKRLLAKAGGGLDVEAVANDAEVIITDVAAIAQGELPVLLVVHQAVKGISTVFDALLPDLRARWFGAVTFPGIMLAPNVQYEAYMKAKGEAIAKAQGVFASAFGYDIFNPQLEHSDINDSKSRPYYGVYLNAVGIRWR